MVESVNAVSSVAPGDGPVKVSQSNSLDQRIDQFMDRLKDAFEQQIQLEQDGERFLERVAEIPVEFSVKSEQLQVKAEATDAAIKISEEPRKGDPRP